MNAGRIMAKFRSLLGGAIAKNDSDLIKQYSVGLNFVKNDYIVELEKENASLKLRLKYSEKLPIGYKKGA
jgi:hypothetical protein